MPFARSPAAALDRARADLASVDAEITALQTDRAAKLIAADDFAVIEQLDRKLENRQRAAVIHRERITALEAAQREHYRQEVERARISAIAASRKKIAARVALAADLEAAARKLAAEWFALVDSDQDLLADWPDELRRPPEANDRAALTAEFASFLYLLGDGVNSIPAPLRSPRFGLASMSGAVENLGEALIASMEAAPFAEKKLEDAA
jgi:hypothetical protein